MSANWDSASYLFLSHMRSFFPEVLLTLFSPAFALGTSAPLQAQNHLLPRPHDTLMIPRTPILIPVVRQPNGAIVASAVFPLLLIVLRFSLLCRGNSNAVTSIIKRVLPGPPGT